MSMSIFVVAAEEALGLGARFVFVLVLAPFVVGFVGAGAFRSGAARGGPPGLDSG